MEHYAQLIISHTDKSKQSQLRNLIEEMQSGLNFDKLNDLLVPFGQSVNVDEFRALTDIGDQHYLQPESIDKVDSYDIYNFVHGSSSVEFTEAFLEIIDKLIPNVDARAYIQADEDPWEQFIRIKSGELLSEEHVPFEDEELDTEVITSGCYVWFHESLPESFDFGYLAKSKNSNIAADSETSEEGEPPLGGTLDNESIEDFLSELQKKEDDFGYVSVDFKLAKKPEAKIKNQVKKIVRATFEEGSCSGKVKSADDRFLFYFGGYVYNCSHSIAFNNEMVDEVFDVLESIGAEDIIIRIQLEIRDDEPVGYYICFKVGESIKIRFKGINGFCRKFDARAVQLHNANNYINRLRASFPIKEEIFNQTKSSRQEKVDNYMRFCEENDLEIHEGFDEEFFFSRFIVFDSVANKIVDTAYGEVEDLCIKLGNVIAKSSNDSFNTEGYKIYDTIFDRVYSFDEAHQWKNVN